MTGGCWDTQEAELHINALEMMAAFFTIKAFAKDCHQISILPLTDGGPYQQKMGVIRSPLLTSQVKELWA